MKRPPSLSSARDFRRVLKDGRTVRPGWATIYLADGPLPSSPSRLGLAVPARAGGAVQRNRIKRRLRAAFRSAAPQSGLDVVIRARPEATRVDFQELERTFRELHA